MKFIKSVRLRFFMVESTPPQPIAITPEGQTVIQMPVGGGRPGAPMSFQDALQTCFQNKYFDFSGRASRSEYWWTYLAYAIGSFIAITLDGITGLGLFSLVLFFGGILPLLGVSIRRLHDLDKSGWWLFIGIIPLIGSILLLIWFVSDGEPMTNAYGAVPTNTLQ